MKTTFQKNDVVKCTTLTAGFEYDQNLAKQHLTLNSIYVIESSITSKTGYWVTLKEIPNIKFNAIFFTQL